MFFHFESLIEAKKILGLFTVKISRRTNHRRSNINCINCVFKSFEFVENDLINVEYDPIDKKLRFIRLVKQDLFQKVSPKFFISTF